MHLREQSFLFCQLTSNCLLLLIHDLEYEVGTVCCEGCLVQVGNGIELEAIGLQFEPYQWCPCGVTWDWSLIVVVIKLLQTSAL